MEVFRLVGRVVLEGGKTVEQGLTSIDQKAAGTASRLESMGAKMQSVGRGMQSAGKSLSMYVTLPLVAAGAAAIKFTSDYEQSLRNAVSVTGLMGKAADDAEKRMNELALQLGAKTAFSAKDAADAMYDLASSGWDVNQMAKGLPGIMDLAAATQSDLGQTTETVTATLAQFGLEAGESGRVADVFTAAIGSSRANMDRLALAMRYVGPIADTLGISLEETTAIIAKLNDAGFEGEQAGTAMRAAFASLQNPIGEAKEALNEAGIAFAAVDPSAHSLEEIIRTLALTTDDAGEQAKLFSRVFGREASGAMLSLIDNTGPTKNSISALTAELKKSEGQAKRTAEMQLDTLGGALESLGGSVETLAIRFGQLLTPSIADLARWLQKGVDWFGNLSEGTQKMILGALGLLAAIGPVVFILGAFVAAAGALLTALSGISAALLAGLGITALGVAFGIAGTEGDTLREKVENLASSLTNTLKSAAESVAQSVREIFDTDTKAEPGTPMARKQLQGERLGLREPTGQDMTPAWEEAGREAGLSFIAALKAIILGGEGGEGGGAGGVANEAGQSFAGQFVTGLTSGIGSGLGKVNWGSFIFGIIKARLATGVGVLNGIVSWIAAQLAGPGMFSGFLPGKYLAGPLNQVITLFQNTWNRAKQSFGQFNSWIRSWADPIARAILWPFQWVYRALLGGSIIPDIVNGIRNWFNKLKGMVSGPLNAVRNAIINAWNQVRKTTTSVFNGIRNLMASVWNGIRAAVQKGVNAARSVVTAGWNAVRKISQSVWNGIRNLLTGVWNGIRGVVQKGVNAARSVVTAGWNFVRKITQSTWNAIKNALTAAWNAIKKLVTSAINAVKNAITQAWNWIKTQTSSAWEAVRKAIVDKFTAAKNTVGKLINGLKTAFSTAWKNIKAGAVAFGEGLKRELVSRVESAVNTVKDWLGTLAKAAGSILIALGIKDLGNKLNSVGSQLQGGGGGGGDGSSPRQAGGGKAAPKTMARGGMLRPGGYADSPTALPPTLYGEAGDEIYARTDRYTPESAKALGFGIKEWARRGWLGKIVGMATGGRLERFPESRYGVRAVTRDPHGDPTGGHRRHRHGRQESYGPAMYTWIPEMQNVVNKVKGKFGVSANTYTNHPPGFAQPYYRERSADFWAKAGRGSPIGDIWSSVSNYATGLIGPALNWVLNPGNDAAHWDHVHVTGFAGGGTSNKAGGGTSVGPSFDYKSIITDGLAKVGGLRVGSGLLGQGLTRMGPKMLGYVKDFLLAEAKKRFGQAVAGLMPGGSAGKTEAEEWVRSGYKAASAFQETDANVAKTLNLAWEESSWNPKAVNPTAVGGEHATGFLQMLPSTFRSYQVRGMSDIMNAVHNTASSLRYQMARYGYPVEHAPYSMGGIAMEDQLVRIGEQGMREAVLPLDNPRAQASTRAALGYDLLEAKMDLLISVMRQEGILVRDLGDPATEKVVTGQVNGAHTWGNSDKGRETIKRQQSEIEKRSRAGGRG